MANSIILSECKLDELRLGWNYYLQEHIHARECTNPAAVEAATRLTYSSLHNGGV